MKIECPSYVNTAFEKLAEKGFKAYAVGGCVRDSLMGRIPNDWDMTTSAHPGETMEVFDGFRIIPTGLKHGTVTVLIEGNPIEITTMRIDGEYHDSRRPDSVEFTGDIATDLSRRDFTVNAMAYSPDEGLVDPFGGREDIERKIIRCVGEADKRFSEDALRIIRAMRFASVLGFEIENNTSESIFRNHRLMENVACERIRVELVKLLTGGNAEKILTDYKEIIFGIIPELRKTDGYPQHTPYHVYDVWTHTVKVVGSIKNEPVFRVAALLHDICKPECHTTDADGIDHFKGHSEKGAEAAKEIMKNLRFSNAEIAAVYNIIMLHECFPDGSRVSLARLCSEYSIEDVRNTLYLMEADAAGKNPAYYEETVSDCRTAFGQLDEFERDNVCLKVSDLAVNGNDLQRLGFAGREIKDALTQLLNMVIEGVLPNEKAVLTEQAKKIKNI